MDLGIAGRWALVCGASSGLGLGCAQALVREGVHVVVNARGAQRLEAAVRDLRAQAQAYAAGREGAHAPSVLAVAADVAAEHGRAQLFEVEGGPGAGFDIVVNNAGGPPPGDFRDWGEAQWLAALQANMLAPIAIIGRVVDGMAERGFGRIVNITSNSVKAPIDVLGLSNGARSGLTGFVAGLARSGIARHGVTINNLLPGKFETARLRALMQVQAQQAGTSAEQIKARQESAVPAGRLGQAEEFGAVCAFLCSQQAGYVNGQNWLVDGGAYPGTF